MGGREKITLEDLLTMRSGLPWDESSTSYTNPANDVVQLFYNPNPIRYILSKEMEAPAGTFSRYNSGATNVLGKVVEIVSGERLDHLAEEALFPLKTPIILGAAGPSRNESPPPVIYLQRRTW